MFCVSAVSKVITCEIEMVPMKYSPANVCSKVLFPALVCVRSDPKVQAKRLTLAIKRIARATDNMRLLIGRSLHPGMSGAFRHI